MPDKMTVPTMALKAMLDDLNIVQAEEVVETVNARVLSLQVDEKVEADDQQRVGEKPKHLEM